MINERITRCVRGLCYYMCFLYYTYIYGTYPFSFIRKLNKKTIGFALHRQDVVQDSYEDKTLQAKRQYIDGIKRRLEESNTCFTVNDYPYNVPRYVKHYVLWVRPGLTMNDEALDNAIRSSIFIEFGMRMNFAYFKNTEKNRSVRDIEHYQVFILSIF